MEGKINQENDNRKRRMMQQSGSNSHQKYHPNPSPGYAPRNNRPPTSRPSYPNRSGGNVKSGGNNHNSGNANNFNRAPPKNNNNNTAPRTGSNDVPVAVKDKSQITCFECGVKGHYSNECPKKTASNAIVNAPA